MQQYYLYIKTHNITKLKYFGYTEKDPYAYTGSGLHWTRHLKTHGKDVTTEIYRECFSMDEVAKYGIEFSIANNIVESSEWANLCIERGQGGSDGHDSETRTKISKNHARCDGARNSNFVGWYVTPWGTFETRGSASKAINNAVSAQSLLKYCRYGPDNKVTKETLKARGKKHLYFTITDIGKTYSELGFGFIRKSQDD